MDLMKKKKSELVDIILRKDDVERNLRADIEGTEAELEKVRAKIIVDVTTTPEYQDLYERYTSLIADNEYASKEILKLSLKNDKLKKRNLIYFISLSVAILGMIAACVF